MKKINFNSGWKFCFNDKKDGTSKIEGEYSVIDLPNDFSIIQERRADAPSGPSGGFFEGGVGKYQKTFMPKKNKKYFFMCDGSFGVTDVFINSHIAYTNKYGYNSFYFDITDYLRYDKENEILIRVNNASQPNARWYAGSGIYRDTFICESDNVYLHPFGTFVKTDSIIENTAYLTLEAIAYAEKKCEATLEFEIFEQKKSAPVSKFTKFVVLDKGENKIRTKFDIDDFKPWDLDTPNMYKIKTKLLLAGACDTDETAFGIRTITVDSKKGLLLNGKSVKLRGGCIHHDQGIVGAAVYPETEYRRVAKLKEAGFNSVRLSHNPQSQYLYEACDRLGMLVIDELFDYWTEGKKQDDFHPYFADNYLKWTEEIVLRNRPHPSIVMWSTGNEIPQKTGRGGGYYIATNIANKIYSLDSSRPITHALCSLWDNSEEYEREKSENDLGAEVLDYFARKTAPTADTTDIVGYNYLEYRLEKDLVRFPKRLFINTETFPLSAYTTIKQQIRNPRILGDYVWTAWDYFGETAIGHVEYNEKRGDFSLNYPYHIADCGDIDIIGQRKPQSYYREIAWELRRDPYIGVRHPGLFDTPYFISGWGFYECDERWCFEGYEGKKAEAYVFADCDEVVLYVNGKEAGRKARQNDGVYKFDVVYEPGEISADAYLGGKKIGTHKIKTEGPVSKIALKQEKSYLKNGARKPERTLIYVDAYAQDEKGSKITGDCRRVSFTAEGAKILGVGSGDLVSKDLYSGNSCNLYKGKCLVALLIEKGARDVTLTANGEGLDPETIKIK